MRLALALLILLFAGAGSALAQSTGAVFPTPSGQQAPGSMVLVPCGSIVNGQPAACPPGPANGLAVTCLNCSPSAPIGAASNPVNGTIAATDTFQELIAQNTLRKGCTIQNQGTHTEYLSVAATPTLASAVQVQPGGFYYCSGPSNIVLTDELWITGTAADAFAGEWQ